MGKTPAIPRGMAGFLLNLHNRNKTFCILIGYVILAICLALPIHPAYGLELSSNSYDVSVISLLQGGGSSTSDTYSTVWTGVGEGTGLSQQMSSTVYSGLSGQLYLFTPVSLGVKYIILDLTAKTDVFGALIPPATWQADNDPYFYWKVVVTPATLIEGFSVGLDTHPDLEVDVTEPDYQFLEDAIPSGKHTFYVLPFTSGKVWQEESLLSFEIWVDTEAPVTSNIEPVAGIVTPDNYIPISCSLSDAHSGIDPFSTTLTINSQSVIFTYDKEKQTLEYKPAAALAEGKNTVLLKAVDAVGNYTVKGWEFIVDTNAPSGEILINGGQEVTYSPYVSININVGDAVSGIKNIYISNDGVFDAELNNPYTYSPVISNWLLAEPDVNGLKSVYVKFEDFAGNFSQAYKAQITLELRTPNTRIISGPATTTEETEATFIYEGSRIGCLFSYKLDSQEWSEWQDTNEASFTGLAAGNHYFYVKSGFDLNGDGKISLEEEDATPAQWVWNIKGAGETEGEEKKEKKTLFWRR
ncbi:MAG: hypothetical protein PHV44_06600 [Candidatus Omnitrophica bacterium]|nr:hypothetical protein [Candidatus Omnitrophota bacterium]